MSLKKSDNRGFQLKGHENGLTNMIAQKAVSLFITLKQCRLNHRSSVRCWDSDTSPPDRRLPHLRSGPPEGTSSSHDPQTGQWLPSVQLAPSVWGRCLYGTARNNTPFTWGIFNGQTRGVMSNRSEIRSASTHISSKQSKQSLKKKWIDRF